MDNKTILFVFLLCENKSIATYCHLPNKISIYA